MPGDVAKLIIDEVRPEWVSNPDPVLQIAWPVLPTAARYGLAGEILEVIEPHSEADPAALLITILAAFGALVGAGPHAVADGAEHPARIWSLIVGDTSKARKGSAWAQVRRILDAADHAFTTDRVLAGFGSGEALVDAVAGDQDRRLLVVEPEYGRILSVAKREGSTLAPLQRQAWDGTRLQVRSRAGIAVADHAHITVSGHITRAELLARLAESDALGGSLNRFLIISARRSKLLPHGGNLDDRDLEPLIRKFALFASQVRTFGIIRRTPEAEDYWADLYGRLAEDDPGGLLGAAIARDSAQILRLQVTYALFDCSKVIRPEHILAAEAVWDYSRASAAGIFGERTGDPISDAILAELQRKGSEGLDGTAIHELLGKHVKADRIDQAIALLEQQGVANKAKKATHGRPRIVLQLANKAKKAKEVESRADFVRSDSPPPIDDDYIASYDDEGES